MLLGAGDQVPETAGELVDAVGKVKTSPTQKGPICIKVGVVNVVRIKLNCFVYKQFVGILDTDIYIICPPALIKFAGFAIGFETFCASERVK